jgi:hypothetical protein
MTKSGGSFGDGLFFSVVIFALLAVFVGCPTTSTGFSLQENLECESGLFEYESLYNQGRYREAIDTLKKKCESMFKHDELDVAIKDSYVVLNCAKAYWKLNDERNTNEYVLKVDRLFPIVFKQERIKVEEEYKNNRKTEYTLVPSSLFLSQLWISAKVMQL